MNPIPPGFSQHAGERSALTGLFRACQFFYGGWFLFHGLNYWCGFYFDPTVQPGPGLVPALAASGVMAIVKALEIAIGLALLLDVFAALAVVAAWPITLMIAFVNSSHLSGFGVSVGIAVIVLNAAMSVAHLDAYRPMLVMRAGPGDAVRLRPLPAALQTAGAIAGIAAAAGVTFLTLYLRH